MVIKMQAFSFKNLFSFTSFSMRKARGVGYNEYLIIVSLLSVFSIAAFQSYGQVIQNQTAGIAGEVSGQAAAQSPSNQVLSNQNTAKSPQQPDRIIMPEGFIQDVAGQNASTSRVDEQPEESSRAGSDEEPRAHSESQQGARCY